MFGVIQIVWGHVKMFHFTFLKFGADIKLQGRCPVKIITFGVGESLSAIRLYELYNFSMVACHTMAIQCYIVHAVILL